jgi:hypothetical protein
MPSRQSTGIVTNLGAEPNLPREVKLQEWEGQIESVGRRYFHARLVDLTAAETEESEEVDFPIEDLTEGDRKLLVPGAVFRWIIGYRYVQRQKDRFSRVVIRRLPIWTTDEIQAADKKAAHISEIFSRHRGYRSAGAGSS